MDTEYVSTIKQGEGCVFVSRLKAGMEGVDNHTSAEVSRAPDQDRPSGEKPNQSVENLTSFTDDSYSQLSNTSMQPH